MYERLGFILASVYMLGFSGGDINFFFFLTCSHLGQYNLNETGRCQNSLVNEHKWLPDFSEFALPLVPKERAAWEDLLVAVGKQETGYFHWSEKFNMTLLSHTRGVT